MDMQMGRKGGNGTRGMDVWVIKKPWEPGGTQGVLAYTLVCEACWVWERAWFG